MPNSVLWVCLVAIWLFVLVPMVIQGRPGLRKSTPVAAATRVLKRGGEAVRNTRVGAGAHPHDPTWKRKDDDEKAPGGGRKSFARADHPTEELEELPLTKAKPATKAEAALAAKAELAAKVAAKSGAKADAEVADEGDAGDSAREQDPSRVPGKVPPRKRVTARTVAARMRRVVSISTPGPSIDDDPTEVLVPVGADDPTEVIAKVVDEKPSSKPTGRATGKVAATTAESAEVGESVKATESAEATEAGEAPVLDGELLQEKADGEDGHGKHSRGTSVREIVEVDEIDVIDVEVTEIEIESVESGLTEGERESSDVVAADDSPTERIDKVDDVTDDVEKVDAERGDVERGDTEKEDVVAGDKAAAATLFDLEAPERDEVEKVADPEAQEPVAEEVDGEAAQADGLTDDDAPVVDEVDADDVEPEVAQAVEAEAELVAPWDDVDPNELTQVLMTRPGRGGYDPEVDKERLDLKYKERQRVLLTLVVLTLITVGAGVLFSTPGWIAAGVMGFFLLAYLVFLRRAVKTESQIRRRRMERLERSRREEVSRRRRDFVAPEENDEVVVAKPRPRVLRPRGMDPVAIDDEDPIFDHLPTYTPPRMMRSEDEYRAAAAG
ncbi:hypothetical protein HUN08_04070 [Gordonia sp. X0973]|nr:gephyrin-like molybdotransferase receptor GlpR [Gordonia sp. X0973]QKT05761.1 hypothetical protein HUN08_04070 [Gordonia sp. X0973]